MKFPHLDPLVKDLLPRGGGGDFALLSCTSVILEVCTDTLCMYTCILDCSDEFDCTDGHFKQHLWSLKGFYSCKQNRFHLNPYELRRYFILLMLTCNYIFKEIFWKRHIRSIHFSVTWVQLISNFVYSLHRDIVKTKSKKIYGIWQHDLCFLNF